MAISLTRNNKEFNWGPGIFLISYQILLLAALPFYFYFSPPSLGMIGVSILLLYLTGLSITAGYHRLFSHRTYKAHPFVEWVVIFFGSMAAQGSILRWSYDHRQHHAYVDTDEDPYSIQKGFWYAHFAWILEKPAEIEWKVVPDLIKNPRVMHQHNYCGLWMIFTNVIAALVVGYLLDDYVGAFFVAVWLRMFALHHFTWFINSLAHTWGDRPFCQEQSAVNNYVISLLTFGEGYHNYHHTYANDYRNGVKWYHFDPSKWLIWTLSRLGLAHGLKKMDWETISKRMILERKRLLIERLGKTENKETLEKEINQVSQNIIDQISTLSTLRQQYRKFKYECNNSQMAAQIRQEIKDLKTRMRNDWREWKKLFKIIQPA